MIERIRNYRITDEIGSGGMAVVYKGVQEPLGRVVAIKALKTALAEDDNIVARFEREAHTLASFQHENIITLYDFFSEVGELFMVMEYVEGIDLYDLLERCPQLPHDVAAMTALQVARALDYAHFRGVIHRDVKPANVILSKRGEVKLTDFGIARTAQSDLTETGIGLGTPSYMSPEQIVGDPIGHHSDIWSLGVLLYQMLAGRKPFLDDEQRSAVQRIRLEDPTLVHQANPRCPPELQPIVTRCLRKKPQDRFGSAQDLAVALEHHLATHVQTNYRARLLIFLREQSVVSADETSAMLHPALIGDYPQASRISSQPSGSGLRVALLAVVLLGCIAIALAGWVLYRQSGSGSDASSSALTVPATAMTEGSNIGYVHVVAHPWARVEIDGTPRATTPIAVPIGLDPGKHVVRLINPYFKPDERDILVEAGTVTRITVALERSERATEASEDQHR